MRKKRHCFNRSAGILLPVSSLPSPYGIGTFGKDAYEWVDILHAVKQSFWQILPLSPTGYGDSPYQSFSAFAGNPYFIDLDTLWKEGLLKRGDYANIKWSKSPDKVDYGSLYKYRESVLRKAFCNFINDAASVEILNDFMEQNHWFDDYGLFMAIKDSQGQHSWLEWDEPLCLRQPEAISRVREELAEDILYHAFVQYQFQKQWNALKSYANEKDVEIIGDIPIYVALDSADVWAKHELFQLDENGVPTEVAGCPPDGFTEDGQLWGNPLYDWAFMKETGFEWWIERLRHNFELYDVVRIDHFRGLESYFAIPGGAKTAADGKWKPGPGMAFIKAVKEALPDARIIAENLGFLTDKVDKLLKSSGYPGMKLVQFAFDSRASEDDQPSSYEENMVIYTGTHDNDTVKGWSRTAPTGSVMSAKKYLDVKRRKFLPRAMIELALESKANLVIIPMQDWLQLGSEARLNTPSTTGGNNWRWRLNAKSLKADVLDSVADLTIDSQRAKPCPEQAKNNYNNKDTKMVLNQAM